jgi:hypothetical protein
MKDNLWKQDDRKILLDTRIGATAAMAVAFGYIFASYPETYTIHFEVYFYYLIAPAYCYLFTLLMLRPWLAVIDIILVSAFTYFLGPVGFFVMYTASVFAEYIFKVGIEFFIYLIREPRK